MGTINSLLNMEVTMEQVLWVAAAITAITGAIWGLCKVIIFPAINFVKKLAAFFDDWFGEPPRPGHKGYPGVPERLQRIEWHVGNGNEVPLWRRVEQTRREGDTE